MEDLEGEVCTDRLEGGAEVRFCTVRDGCNLRCISLVLRWRIWRGKYAQIGWQRVLRSIAVGKEATINTLETRKHDGEYCSIIIRKQK